MYEKKRGINDAQYSILGQAYNAFRNKASNYCLATTSFSVLSTFSGLRM